MRVQFLLRNTGMHERLGIMQLSAIAKQRGHQVRLLVTDDLSEGEIVQRVTAWAPHVLAYSIMTGEHNYHLEINRMVRAHHGALSVFGGPHPTFMPEMIEEPGVDAVCIGEGDICLVELLDRMRDGADYTHLPNLWFSLPDGSVVRNEMGPLVEDLDTLPFPDRELMYEADPKLKTKGNKLFMAMRGCPYKCTYCFNHAYNRMTADKGKMLRTRSVANLMAEIRQVKERWPLDQVWIDDDTFLIKPKGWLEEFAAALPREIGLPFYCNIRANLLSDESVAALLARAGCHHVWMGVECGDNEVARTVLKRNLSNDKIALACANLQKHGVKIVTQNLIGLPVDDPLAVDLKTLDFNIALAADYAWSSILYPYPETEIGRLAVERGQFDADFRKIQVSNKSTTALNFDDPEIKRRIVNLHKLFGIVVEYPFLRPHVERLIGLPLERVYTWMYWAFYGYKGVYAMQSRAGLLNIAKQYGGFFVKYVSGLEKKRRFTIPEQKAAYPNADFLRGPVAESRPSVKRHLPLFGGQQDGIDQMLRPDSDAPWADR